MVGWLDRWGGPLRLKGANWLLIIVTTIIAVLTIIWGSLFRGMWGGCQVSRVWALGKTSDAKVNRMLSVFAA